jgi:hypothetical protein
MYMFSLTCLQPPGSFSTKLSVAPASRGREQHELEAGLRGGDVERMMAGDEGL